MIRELKKYLDRSNSIIHVGASWGQEREEYDKYDLEVLWIEAIPSVYETLQENIQDFSKQYALNELITDVDDKEYMFNLSSNGGASSSIYDFGVHRERFAHVEMEDQIKLTSKTLNRLFREQNIHFDKFDGMVLDTQGSELDVMRGAQEIIPHLDFIRTEASDFNLYEDANLLSDIIEWLNERGFEEVDRHIHFKYQGKDYCDAIFENKN